LIKPTIGRKVWYRHDGGPIFASNKPDLYPISHGPQPMDATVIYVYGDRMVNLDVTDHAGNRFTVTSCTLIQEGDDPVTTRYCEWMPYQQGQAKKGVANADATADKSPVAQAVPAAQAVDINAMVNRFLGWKLPKDFQPDSGISFSDINHRFFGGYEKSWPTGTNLLTAEQARAMFEHALGGSPTAAASDVLAERQRQISVEGWTPEHDDEHDCGELARGAAAYILELFDVPVLKMNAVEGIKGPMWPWEPYQLKPSNARVGLVKAGALILAEIERIDRAADRGEVIA